MQFSYGLNLYDTIWIGPFGDGEQIYIPPVQMTCEWTEYLALLKAAATELRRPEQKNKTPWTSPVMLGDEGEGRAMDNVVGVANWMGFDLDKPGWDLDRLNHVLRGLQRILYTTTHSRAAQCRWRIILATDRAMSVAEAASVWRFVNQALHGDLDPSTCNANRILIVPAKWVGANNLFASADGDPLCVDDILAAGFEPVPIEFPEPVAILDGDYQRPEWLTVVTDRMVAKFREAHPGGRFYRLLCQAAKYHRINNWRLSDTELCEAAMQISRVCAPQVKRQHPLREAQRALAWAELYVTPKSALERERDRREFSLKHSSLY